MVVVVVGTFEVVVVGAFVVAFAGAFVVAFVVGGVALTGVAVAFVAFGGVAFVAFDAFEGAFEREGNQVCLTIPAEGVGNQVDQIFVEIERGGHLDGAIRRVFVHVPLNHR